MFSIMQCMDTKTRDVVILRSIPKDVIADTNQSDTTPYGSASTSLNVFNVYTKLYTTYYII